MKKLSTFERFDAQAFLKGKKLIYISGSVESNSFKGVKIELLIANDQTDYDGVVGVNFYERLNVKVEGVGEDYLKQFQLNDEVYLDNPKMRIWGKDGMRNNLSITAYVKKVSK